MNHHTIEVKVTSANVLGSEKFSPRMWGRLVSIAYIKHGTPTVAFTDSVDFDVDLEHKTAAGIVFFEEVWSEDAINASEVVRPKPRIQDTAGDDLQIVTAGGEALVDKDGFALVGQRLRFGVKDPGTDKEGYFVLTLSGGHE